MKFFNFLKSKLFLSTSFFTTTVTSYFLFKKPEQQKTNFFSFFKQENIKTNFSFKSILPQTVYCLDKTPIFGVPGTKKERTFMMVKPDGVQKGIIGEVVTRMEKKRL